MCWMLTNWLYALYTALVDRCSWDIDLEPWMHGAIDIVLELKEGKGVVFCNPNTALHRYSCQAILPIVFMYMYIVSYVNEL